MTVKEKARELRHGAGQFAQETEGLLSLFDDPDARGGRRWREVFEDKSTRGRSLSDLYEMIPRLF